MTSEDNVIADVEALIKNLELPYLKKINLQLQHEIKKREDSTITDAIVKMQQIAKSVGMTPEQLLQIKPTSKTPKSTLPVQYRDPANQKNEWSGFGRQPNWIKEYLGKGKSLSDFRIKT